VGTIQLWEQYSCIAGICETFLEDIGAHKAGSGTKTEARLSIVHRRVSSRKASHFSETLDGGTQGREIGHFSRSSLMSNS
jgi:hypothetical protein